jgi:hypothetical protein
MSAWGFTRLNLPTSTNLTCRSGVLRTAQALPVLALKVLAISRQARLVLGLNLDQARELSGCSTPHLFTTNQENVMTKSQLRKSISAALTLCAFGLSTASASVVSLTAASFGAPKVTFSEVALGTAFNGLSINGFGFAETILNTTVSNGGPGNTNSVTQPSALGGVNPAGQVITVTLPEMSTAFGFAYALLGAGTIPDGVTVTLFDDATNLGSLGFTAVPDPDFPGGFAGIGSTIAFNKATITFISTVGAYDLDNFNSVAAVPVPGSLALVALALCLGAGGCQRRTLARAV